MSVSNDEISSWLDQTPEIEESPLVNEADIESYLDKPAEQVTEKEQETHDNWYTPVVQTAAGFNDEVLDLLDLFVIPDEAFNWAADKMGVDFRIPGAREIGADLDIGYAEGDEPDTGSYKAGQYTALGLEFLAPILRFGKVAAGVESAPGVAKRVAQTINKPFVSSPKQAMAVELAGGYMSGMGAHYGEQEWGDIGEQIGGLVGVAPAMLAGSARRASDYIVKSVFPFTEKGARAKASDVIKQLRESPQFVDEIKRQEALSLEKTKHTPAKLSKDLYLIALEKALVHDDSELAHTLRQIDLENNTIAKMDLRELAGDAAIEDAQKALTSRYGKLKVRLDMKVDQALKNVQNKLSGLTSNNQRKSVNIAVRQEIEKSLSLARDAENKLWNLVDKRAIAPTLETKSAFRNVLNSRELEADPTDIPNYLHTFLGRVDKTGALKGGKYADSRNVGGLHQLRSRLLQDIRKEKAGEAPDWNKVRILEDIEEGILKDMSASSAAKGMDDALNFSRELNKKFKGDIMSMILRNSKTGGSLAPELTLDSLGAGEKGAYHIKRILAASPESKVNIEEVLKMDMVQQKIIKDDMLDIRKVKDYLLKNDEIMNMFPALREDVQHAIGLAETHKYFEGTAAQRLKKAEQALGFALSKPSAKPGSFLNQIMSAKEPEKAMQRVVRQVNQQGKEGIKNDIVDMIINKSKTSDLGTDETFMLSGKKALGFWNENKKTLSKAMSGEEITRLERILNDLRLGDEPSKLPIDVAKEALVPEKTILGYAIEVAAARTGAMFGKGTSGASLKTASQAANTARRIMGNLDIGAAKKLLKDAIQDKDLYIALSEDMTKLPDNKRAFKVLQSWMLAHAVSTLESQTRD
jgi:hypothetical protein